MKPKPKKTEGQDTKRPTQQGEKEQIEEVKDYKEEVDRLAEIWTELRLEKNEMLKEKPELKRKLSQMLDRYQDVFSEPDHI